MKRGCSRPLNAFEDGVGIEVGDSGIDFYTLAVLVVMYEKQWMSVKSEQRTLLTALCINQRGEGHHTHEIVSCQCKPMI